MENGNQRFRILIEPMPAIIIAAAFVLAAIIGAFTFYGVRSLDNTLSVTGSSKTSVVSDSAKWTFSITRRSSEYEMQANYSRLAKDLEGARAFLKANKIPDDQITTSQVFVNENYKYGPESSGPREFTLQQTVTVNSKNVKEIEALSKNITALAEKGIFVVNNYVEYFVTNLPELRVSLLANAIKDAKARAEQIAKAGGQKVGSLKSASSGVVQVLQANSIEISDYGQYDTQSINKEVMVTVRASFFVK